MSNIPGQQSFDKFLVPPSFTIPKSSAKITMPVQGLQQSLPLTLPQSFSQSLPQTLPQGLPQSFSQGLPQTLPLTLPQSFSQGLPQTLPQTLPQGLPQSLPLTLPQSFSQGLPQTLPQGLPQSLPLTLPQSFSQGLPQTLPQGLPQGFPQGLPQMSPQIFTQPSITKVSNKEEQSRITINNILLYMPGITIMGGSPTTPILTANIDDLLHKESDESKDDFDFRRVLTYKLLAIPNYQLNNVTAMVVAYMLMRKARLGITYDRDIESALTYLLNAL
jgi:hypothetical protein